MSGVTPHIPTDAVSVRRFGVAGDGVTEDQVALQAALDSGEKYITAERGKTYLVENSGNSIAVRGAWIEYGLKIPSGVILDLNGATLKAKDASNCSVILNAGAAGDTDTDLGMINGTIDCNQANQTVPATGEMAGIHFWGVTRPRVENLRVDNAREFAGRFLNISEGHFVNLNAYGSYGDGWSFGLSANSEEVIDSFIDRIFARDIAGTFAARGNPTNFVVQDTQVGMCSGINCAGGHKIQDLSQDSNFQGFLFVGGALSTTNSGLKVQGNSGAGQYPTNINIGRVMSRDCEGQGLYLEECIDVSIGSYVGYDCAQSGTVAAVWLSGTRTNVGQINQNLCGQIGVELRSTLEGHVETIKVHNPNGSAVQGSPVRFTFGTIESSDDRGGGALLKNSLYLSNADPLGSGGTIHHGLAIGTGASDCPIRLAAGAYKYQVDHCLTEGVADRGHVTLTNASTTTVVANANIYRFYIGGAGDYITPIIEVMAYDASAMALGAMRTTVTDIAGTKGFTIHHALAGANDEVFWRVVGWQVVDVLAA